MNRPVILLVILTLYGCMANPARDPEVMMLSRIGRETTEEVDVMAKETAAYIDSKGEATAKVEALARAKYDLKDPDSAQFRDVVVKPYKAGKVFCGEINARNSYGGYVGFRPFVAGVSSAQVFRDENGRNVRINTAKNIGIGLACGRYGIAVH